MKTKNISIFLFFFILSITLNAQDYSIVGPLDVCVGECHEYFLVNEFGDTVGINGGEWDVYSYPNSLENSIIYCFDKYDWKARIRALNSDGEVIAELKVQASKIIYPDIVALSEAYCFDEVNSSSIGSCKQICSNSQITYTTSLIEPSQEVNWSVYGAESYMVNDKNVIVDWGEPGIGQIGVEVSPPVFSIICKQWENERILWGGGDNGAGYVEVYGPPNNFYSIAVSNGMNAMVQGGSNTTFKGLTSGIYSVTVTNSEGIAIEDYFRIYPTIVFHPFRCGFNKIFTSSDCQSCDGSLTAIPLYGVAPFTYEWDNGSTAQTIENICPWESHRVTISDSAGSSVHTTGNVICNKGLCSGEKILCVEVIEKPESAFGTIPPISNGVIEVCEGQSIFFENQTSGASKYIWDFGNEISSSEVDVEYAYQSSGVYEVLLIAEMDCFCKDTASVTVIVSDAISPKIDCVGTVCSDSEVTYSTDSDCGTFNWNVSPNGTILSGGDVSDNFITVEWEAGPEGFVELSVDNCNGNYCLEPMYETIPVIDGNAIIKGPDEVCKDAKVVYSITGFTGTEFNWSVSSYGIIKSGQGTNEISIQWANAIPATQQWVVVQYENCYLGCGGEDSLFVNILEDFYIEGPIEICNNETINFLSKKPPPSSSAVQCNWTIFDDDNSTVFSTSGATNNFEVDWSFGSGNFMVYAEIDNPDDFCMDNYTVFVEVPAETPPALGIDGAEIICPGETYTYTAIGAGAGFQYTWYISNGSSNVILNGQSVNITWAASPPYNLAVTQTNTIGLACESPDIGMGLQIINAVSLEGTLSGCHEEIGIYTATAFQSVDYDWQIIPANAGTVVAGANTNEIEIQWHDVGNFEVQVAVCGFVDVQIVLVNPRPVPQVFFDDACPEELTFVQTTLDYNTYDWRDEYGETIGNNPTTNLGTGYYELVVTDENGCTENETFFIGELTNPYTTISTPDFGNFCDNGGSMTLYALETTEGLDYQWYQNGNQIGGNASSLLVTQEGSYYVIVTNSEGCDSISNILGLNCSTSFPGGGGGGCTPDGYLDFTNNPGVYCNESQYINSSYNDVPNTWDWRFVDVIEGTITYSSLENPTHIFQNAGFHIVYLWASIYSTTPGNSCYSYVYQFDTVPLAANFSFEKGCAGELLSFKDQSSFIPQTSIAGWEWDFGDPASGAANTSILQNPQHAFTYSDTFTVTLTVTDQSGCISVLQKNVRVLPAPLSNFEIPALGCVGTTVFFSAEGSFTDVLWDFGDPNSGVANISKIGETYHQFESPGVYTVTLTAENIYGCVVTVSEQINIESNTLSGNVDVDPASIICEGDSTILTAPGGTSFEWSTGNINPIVTVLETGVYEVTIFDAFGCSYSPPSVPIDVIASPEAQITAVEYNQFEQPVAVFYNSYETCFGEDVYLEITQNFNYSYEWSTTDHATTISFTEDKDNLLSVGDHQFSVTVTETGSGCTNVVGPFEVIVHPSPENIQISSDPLMPVCENMSTVFEVINPDASFTYIWNTGIIGTAMTSFYAGEYFVRAINEFGCEGLSNTLEITAGPNIDLIPSGCHSRCNPDTICLPYVPGVLEFQWFHDGNPIAAPDGIVGDYIATESGEYHVEMINDQGCLTVSDVLSLDLFESYGSILGNVYFDINNNGIIDSADTLMDGISIILQNANANLDTIESNLLGAFAFSNISALDYEVLVDILNLPSGMIAVIEQVNTELAGCDDEKQVAFLIQSLCGIIVENLVFEACEGTTTQYNGDDLSAGTTAQYIFTNTIGCDSIVEVEVVELFESVHSITLQACGSNTVEYNGVNLTDGSVTNFIFPNAVGCDSTVTITVNNLPEDNSMVMFETCTETMVEYDGTMLNPGSQTDFYYTNSSGCDSVITVIVDELQTYSTELQLETCTGTTVLYNGQDLSPGTAMDFVFLAENGCDSMVSIFVEELMLSTSQLQFEACDGSSVFYNGDDLPTGSTTEYTFVNMNGCDSVITVEVNPLEVYSFDLELTACEGDYILYNGMQIPAGTSQDFILMANNGCDSTVSVDVVPLANYTSNLELTACDGDYTTYNSTQIPAGSTQDFVLSAANGCDSIVMVSVIPIPLSYEEIDLATCEGTTINYNGEDLTPGSVTEFTFISSLGCDSMVTVNVGTLFNTSSALGLSACENGTVPYNGQNLQPGSVSMHTFANEVGCDSLVTVTVASIPVDETFIDLFACLNEMVEYNNEQLPSGIQIDYTFINQDGCDSIVHVNVIAYPDFSYDLFPFESCWNAAEGEIIVEYLVGGTAPFEYSLDGIIYQPENNFMNITAGDYEVFVKDDNGCVNTQMVTVESISPMNIVAEDPLLDCEFGSALLQPQVIADDPQEVSYLWPDGSTAPFYQVDSSGIYTVAISNTCETIDFDYNVEYKDDERSSLIFIPNVFSPNGDGVNDEFRVYVANEVQVLFFELNIFDRWGNQVSGFTSTNDFWDGKLDNSFMNPGVFVYYYKATIIACGQKVDLFRKGDVTLVK